MTSQARRPLVILLASLLIVAGGADLGAGLKIMLSGDEFPATQLALMAVGGTLALSAGIALLRERWRIVRLPPFPHRAHHERRLVKRSPAEALATEGKQVLPFASAQNKQTLDWRHSIGCTSRS